MAIASFTVFKPKEAPVTLSSPALPATDATNSPSPTPSSSLATTSPVEVSMTLTDEAWMQITVDGSVVFEGVKPKDFQKVWSAQKSVTIKSGNAGAVMLAYNQEPAKPMGQLGEVQEISFPKVAPTSPAQ
jgi:cytoskeletal protein RodZ